MEGKKFSFFVERCLQTELLRDVFTVYYFNITIWILKKITNVKNEVIIELQGYFCGGSEMEVLMPSCVASNKSSLK